MGLKQRSRIWIDYDLTCIPTNETRQHNSVTTSSVVCGDIRYEPRLRLTGQDLKQPSSQGRSHSIDWAQKKSGCAFKDGIRFLW